MQELKNDKTQQELDATLMTAEIKTLQKEVGDIKMEIASTVNNTVTHTREDRLQKRYKEI